MDAISSDKKYYIALVQHNLKEVLIFCRQKYILQLGNSLHLRQQVTSKEQLYILKYCRRLLKDNDLFESQNDKVIDRRRDFLSHALHCKCPQYLGQARIRSPKFLVEQHLLSFQVPQHKDRLEVMQLRLELAVWHAMWVPPVGPCTTRPAPKESLLKRQKSRMVFVFECYLFILYICTFYSKYRI